MEDEVTIEGYDIIGRCSYCPFPTQRQYKLERWDDDKTACPSCFIDILKNEFQIAKPEEDQQ